MISQEQLLTYNVCKPVVIQCDASIEGLGATLLQEDHPVVSVSRSLTKSECNYTVCTCSTGVGVSGSGFCMPEIRSIHIW